MKNADIRDSVSDVCGEIDFRHFILADRLHNVYENFMYSDWGHDTFALYVNSELGMQLRKAMYLVTINRLLQRLVVNNFGVVEP